MVHKNRIVFVVVLAMLLMFSLVANAYASSRTFVSFPCSPTETSQEWSAEEQECIQLINQARMEAGVDKVTEDSQLMKLARQKALDMVENQYYGHTSPKYGNMAKMLQEAGIKCTHAGESLVLSKSVTSAHKALMKSKANRDNIINAKFSRVGVGIASQGTYLYIVEVFTNDVDSQPSNGSQDKPIKPESPEEQGTQTKPDNDAEENSPSSLTADEQDMLKRVNEERKKVGLSSLKANVEVTKVARIKAQDMIDHHYFSHTSPTYGSPFQMLQQFGIAYGTAGENLAGASSVSLAHSNLMNSSGHRANILNVNYSEVGIGIVDGGPYGKIFVQLYIG